MPLEPLLLIEVLPLAFVETVVVVVDKQLAAWVLRLHNMDFVCMVDNNH